LTVAVVVHVLLWRAVGDDSDGPSNRDPESAGPGRATHDGGTDGRRVREE